MNSKWLATMLLVSMAPMAGCKTVQDSIASNTPSVSEVPTQILDSTPVPNYEAPEDLVRAVRYDDVPIESEASPGDQYLIQDSLPSADLIPANSGYDSDTGLESTPSETPANLEYFEQMAMAAHPAIQERLAEIESLRGKLIQAGLPPNPTVGLNVEDINEDGGSGRYGVYFGREIVRGNKLGLSRAVVCAEIETAEQQLAELEQRLKTDVKQRFYETLVAQEKLLTAKELVDISTNAVNVSTQLVEAQEASRTAVLQSELELQNALVVLRQAENQQLAARRKLAALLGEQDLPNDRVDGNARDLVTLDDFEKSYDELVAGSPEIAALFADVQQKQRRWARECVEPISNLTWQTTLQYDTVSDDLVTGFQVGMPIPLLNQNQGAIHQARFQVVAAERRAEKKALELRQRLASAYESYLAAQLQIDAYDKEIIPRAKETLELTTDGYRQGEIDFIQLLTAQRTYSQINLTYLEQLQQLWQQNVQIRGMLLNGSLQ